jgi:hypothetical protein
VRAAGLRSAVAILIAGSGVTLLVGSASAETAAVAEMEAPDGADAETRAEPAPDSGPQQDRSQRREAWWAHAREVLFSDIELSAEQSRGVDAILETQLETRKRAGEVRAELAAIDPQADPKRNAALLAESRELRAQRKGPHACIEEMRELLSEDQLSTFDMNRARLAAEGQEAPKQRRQRKAREGREAREGAEEKTE